MYALTEASDNFRLSLPGTTNANGSLLLNFLTLCVCVCVVNFMSQQVECAVKADRGVGMHEGEGQQHNATTPTPPADTQLEVFFLIFFSFFFLPHSENMRLLCRLSVCEGICVCVCVCVYFACSCSCLAMC